MNDVRNRIKEMLNELQQERDELKVKLRLAKMQAGDEWEKLEDQLEKLEAKSKELGSAASDASQDIGAAAKLLAEEIANGFNKIRKHL
jgi:chromosome segregation ATPase